MAKKQTNPEPIDEQPDDEQPVGYENVEPIAVDDGNLSDWVPVEMTVNPVEKNKEFARRHASGESISSILDSENVEPEWTEDPTTEAVITKSGGEAVALTPPAQREYRVSFALPYGVLVVLLDPKHPDADLPRAVELGLFKRADMYVGDHVTQIGFLVLAGFDKVAVGHKMAATWREQHNRSVDGA